MRMKMKILVLCLKKCQLRVFTSGVWTRSRQKYRKSERMRSKRKGLVGSAAPKSN